MKKRFVFAMLVVAFLFLVGYIVSQAQEAPVESPQTSELWTYEPIDLAVAELPSGTLIAAEPENPSVVYPPPNCPTISPEVEWITVLHEQFTESGYPTSRVAVRNAANGEYLGKCGEPNGYGIHGAHAVNNGKGEILLETGIGLQLWNPRTNSFFEVFFKSIYTDVRTIHSNRDTVTVTLYHQQSGTGQFVVYDAQDMSKMLHSFVWHDGDPGFPSQFATPRAAFSDVSNGQVRTFLSLPDGIREVVDGQVVSQNTVDVVTMVPQFWNDGDPQEVDNIGVVTTKDENGTTVYTYAVVNPSTLGVTEFPQFQLYGTSLVAAESSVVSEGFAGLAYCANSSTPCLVEWDSSGNYEEHILPDTGTEYDYHNIHAVPNHQGYMVHTFYGGWFLYGGVSNTFGDILGSSDYEVSYWAATQAFSDKYRVYLPFTVR